VCDRKKEQRKAKDRQKVGTSGGDEDMFVADREDDEDAMTEDLHEGDCPEDEEVGASSKGLPGMYKALDGSALVAIGRLIFARSTHWNLNQGHQACYYKSSYPHF
jgi:hypothetical protein